MRDYLEIGPCPPGERCAQVGEPGYEWLARLECRLYAAQLTREFPAGVFAVKRFSHDFGAYYEVVAYLDTEAATEAAYEAEGAGPEKWDAQAKDELARERLQRAILGEQSA